MPITNATLSPVFHDPVDHVVLRGLKKGIEAQIPILNYLFYEILHEIN